MPSLALMFKLALHPTPTSWSHTKNALSKPVKDLQVKSLIHCLFGGPKFLSHQRLPELGNFITTTPRHTALSLLEFLTSKGITVVPQPAYSPDLSPCDYFLFPKLKLHLKGHHFGTLENIQKATTDQLKAIPLQDFQHCYDDWVQRFHKCVASQGAYFEGDNIDL